ncbi:MAG: hypothetical protein EKK52_20360, partial [Burkholderiales bacterium]
MNRKHSQARELRSALPRRLSASLRPLALAAATAACASAAHAGPAVAHWTLTDIGTLGGITNVAAINNLGQVTGSSNDTDGIRRAVLFSNGVLSSLDNTPGTASTGSAINDAGQITGWAGLFPFVYGNGALSLGPDYGTGNAINSRGQVVGFKFNGVASCAATFSNTLQAKCLTLTLGGNAFGINNRGAIVGNGSVGAFLYNNGTVLSLGHLGGGWGSGIAINDSGDVVGFSDTANKQSHAFLYRSGAMRDLGTLGGANSSATSINSAGLVVGASDTIAAGASGGFLYSNGVLQDINSFNGIAGGGIALVEAKGINDVGQIVANGNNGRAYIATLDTTVWEGNTGGGYWDAPDGWSHGIAPNKNTAVFIDPAKSTTVTVLSGSTTVRSLNIGGDASGNNGIATLNLQGGSIQVTGISEDRFSTVISDKGVLQGDGLISGLVLNRGTVDASNLTLPGGLVNTGLLTGNGRLNANLDNAPGGTLQLGAGQRLVLSGVSHSSEGLIQLSRGAELRVVGAFTHNSGAELNLSGGSLARFASSASNAGDIIVSGASTLRFDDVLANMAGGRLALDQGNAHFNGGLVNAGQLLVSYGGANVYGKVSTVSGGKIILSANSNTAFYGPVEVQQGGELRLAAGSSVTFFGSMQQRTGAIFRGSGSILYEGSLSVGASPGLGVSEGDVSFGSGNTYLAEIGGTTACTLLCATDEAFKNSSYDRYEVGGKLHFGGTLKIVSWAGFTGQAGQSFAL